ncbi:MAG: hypothetical protein P4L69_00045 [Desulfosporosinus sp.]|nr:hypothetical protein [Desulfosporosinus sp.]
MRKFDPGTQLPDYASVLFAGGRRTGKSFCGRDFAWHIRKRVYDAKIYSGTIDEDHKWDRYTPKRLVHYCLEEFDELNMLKDIRMQEKRKRLAEKYNAVCPPTLLLFEDIGHLTPSIWKSKPMISTIYNGRWSKTYTFLMLQYLIELRKGFRGSIDIAVFTRESNAQIRKLIYENFGGCFASYAQFETVFFKCTENHKVMVIDCRANSYDITSNIFWYKAKDRGYFKMGHPDVWAHGNEEFADSDPEEDAATAKALTQQIKGKKGTFVPLDVKLMDDATKGDWGSDGEWDESIEPSKKHHHHHHHKKTH